MEDKHIVKVKAFSLHNSSKKALGTCCLLKTWPTLLSIWCQAFALDREWIPWEMSPHFVAFYTQLCIMLGSKWIINRKIMFLLYRRKINESVTCTYWKRIAFCSNQDKTFCILPRSAQPLQAAWVYPLQAQHCRPFLPLHFITNWYFTKNVTRTGLCITKSNRNISVLLSNSNMYFLWENRIKIENIRSHN